MWLRWCPFFVKIGNEQKSSLILIQNKKGKNAGNLQKTEISPRSKAENVRHHCNLIDGSTTQVKNESRESIRSVRGIEIHIC